MDQSRYRDKSYLVTYELTTEIFDSFDLLVDDIVPIRSVYMLYTDKGIKVLKKINYGLEELQFINSIIEYIIQNGYKYVVSFMKTTGDNYYIQRDDGIYVVLNLVEGREADYRNPIDLGMVSKSLCLLHKATHGMGETINRRNNLYKWIPAFEKRANDLLKFKEIAGLHEIKSGFDRLFLSFADTYYNDALKSIELLKNSDYERLCNIVSKDKNICHHDLAYHNVLIDNDSNVNFVDFDFSIMDLRIHDIGNLIVKSIKNCNWDIEKAENIIDNYCSIDLLVKEEIEVLYDFLVFPQDFYDISRCYYMKTKKWDEDDFLSKLEVKTGYYDDRKAFLSSFNKLSMHRGF